MAGSKPRRKSYLKALTGMAGILVSDQKSSPVTRQPYVVRVQPKVDDAIFFWDMAGGKEGWHEIKVTAILPKRFTVLFKDGERFDISKQSTKRVCWTVD